MGSTSVAHAKLLPLGICVTFCIVIFTTLARFILDANDRTQCDSMLNDGAWLDDDTWQPAGCMLHMYQTPDISRCLNHSHILYIGDTSTQHRFFSLAALMDKDIDTTATTTMDRNYKFEELTMEFWWDPFLNSTRTLQYLHYSGAVAASAGIPRPSLLVVGSSFVSLPQWQGAMDRVFEAVRRTNQVADAVLISPPDDNNGETSTFLATQHLQPRKPFAIPFVWSKLAAAPGWETQLALNYRCNDLRPKHFPYAATCCFHYPKPRWYQNTLFVFFFVLVPAGLYLGDTRLSQWLPSENVLQALFVFGLGVIYMYFGDRTQLFGKMHKHFDSSTFTVLMVLFLGVAGLGTLQGHGDGGGDFMNRDQTDEWKGWMQVIILIYHFMGASGTSGINNVVRVLVAAYLFQTGYGHFNFFYKKADFGLARVLNVLVRLNFLTFVLQYLMDTDYLSYYFTPLVSFWFAAIYATMYLGHAHNKNGVFVVVKIAMAGVGTTALIHIPGALEACFEALRLVFAVDWDAAEWRFRLSLDGSIVYVGMLCALANIKCLEHKWTSRPVFARVKIGALVASGVALVWYFWFELTRKDKFAYNSSQSYVSWLPILAFVFLRNATARLRNTSSRFFVFIGKISLETFIGQFHMWLAGDTKGLLVVLPQRAWVVSSAIGWYTNLVVSTVLFIFVSYYLSQTTGELTRWICSDLLLAKAHRGPDAHTDYQVLHLLPTSSQQEQSSSSITTTGTTLNEEDGFVGPTASETEIIGEHSPQSKPPSLWRTIILDPWVKVVLFFTSVGIMNRFS